MKQPEFSMEILLENGTITEKANVFIEKAVQGKCNLLISGGTGSGKTTLLDVLEKLIPDEEKVVGLADINELHFNRTHFLSIEFQRMRKGIVNPAQKDISVLVDFVFDQETPDVVLFGEFRNAGAYETIYGAANSGKQFMGTIYGKEPKQALSRFIEAGSQTPYVFEEEKFKKLTANELDLIIQINRLTDGSRRITQISQVVGYDVSRKDILVQDLFGLNEAGQLVRTKTPIHTKLLAKIAF